MPEGHTIHRAARAWKSLVGRQAKTTSPQRRFAEGARLLDGRVVEDVQAYGKHLLADFGDLDLHVHLGLAGSIFEAAPGGTPGSGVRLRIAAEPSGPTWDVVAPIRCEVWDADQRKLLLDRLGPDPLRGDDPKPAFDKIAGSSRPIGCCSAGSERHRRCRQRVPRRGPPSLRAPPRADGILSIAAGFALPLGHLVEVDGAGDRGGTDHHRRPAGRS
jgi:hypothetical protein